MFPSPLQPSVLSRRAILRTGVLAGAAATLRPSLLLAQAAAPADPVAQMRAPGATTPISITKLRGNLSLLQGAGGNMAAQIGPDGKLLIDSSFQSAVPRILEALASLSADPNRTLINTHWHIDHTDGNQGLHAAGFSIAAHSKTRERLSSPQSIKLLGVALPAYPSAAWPTLAFDDSLHLWHNGESIRLAHFAPAHTDTDISIHFENANVLHLGDTWFNGFYPFIDEGTGGTIGGMIQAKEKALALADSSTQIIPGHGPLGTRADLQKCHDMLSTVRDRIAKIKATGASEKETIAQNPTADLDPIWGKGFLNPATFLGIVYRTV